MTIGIYKIENLCNSKKYFGQSKNVEGRIREHKSKLRGGYHRNDYLQRSWNKYGEDSFEFKLIKPTPELFLDPYEKLYIHNNKSMDPKYGYNLESGGNENKTLSPETRVKLSKAHLGKEPWNKGKPRSPETKKKISESKTGKTLSEEHKMEISRGCNSSGFFRVSKETIKDYKQGFAWIYKYYDENGKDKKIRRADLSKLMLKVTLKDLPWKIVDIEKAMNTINVINKQKEMI